LFFASVLLCQVASSPTFTRTPRPTCGNAKVESGEQCDDGNKSGGDGCSAACTIESGFRCQTVFRRSCCSRCGDGRLGPQEQCDDGNIRSGDGCNATCGVERTFYCYSCNGKSVCNKITLFLKCSTVFSVEGYGADAVGELTVYEETNDVYRIRGTVSVTLYHYIRRRRPSISILPPALYEGSLEKTVPKAMDISPKDTSGNAVTVMLGYPVPSSAQGYTSAVYAFRAPYLIPVQHTTSCTASDLENGGIRRGIAT